MLAKVIGIQYLPAAGMIYVLWRLSQGFEPFGASRKATGILLLTCSLTTVGCGYDMPEAVEPRNEAGLFSHPDTAEVQVLGEVSAGEVDYRSPRAAVRKWLDEHGYAHVRTEYDSLGTELLRNGENDSDAIMTSGETVVGNRIYVHAP